MTTHDTYFIALSFAGILSTLIIATMLVVALLQKGARHGRLYFTSTAFALQW